VLREKFPDIRYSDLDTDDDAEVQKIIDRVSRNPETKTAVHGRGDNWTEVGPGASPYDTSPLVNYAPEFGGRWRKNFPGSGGQHINDDSDNQKDTKGQATDEDFDPVLKRKKINDARDRGDSYVVRVTLPSGEEPNREKAVEYFGDDGGFDEDGVFKGVDSYEDALELERELLSRGLSAEIETRHERSK
jgi:hypothetical protein